MDIYTPSSIQKIRYYDVMTDYRTQPINQKMWFVEQVEDQAEEEMQLEVLPIPFVSSV